MTTLSANAWLSYVDPYGEGLECGKWGMAAYCFMLQDLARCPPPIKSIINKFYGLNAPILTDPLYSKSLLAMVYSHQKYQHIKALITPPPFLGDPFSETLTVWLQWWKHLLLCTLLHYHPSSWTGSWCWCSPLGKRYVESCQANPPMIFDQLVFLPRYKLCKTALVTLAPLRLCVRFWWYCQTNVQVPFSIFFHLSNCVKSTHHTALHLLSALLATQECASLVMLQMAQTPTSRVPHSAVAPSWSF